MVNVSCIFSDDLEGFWRSFDSDYMRNLCVGRTVGGDRLLNKNNKGTRNLTANFVRKFESLVFFEIVFPNSIKFASY